jgi:predicted nuclease of predicted toxin-antitoxin system
MRVLLDECVPRKLANQLPGHVVQTVPEAGLAGTSNGELLRLAELAGSEAFLTIDRGFEYQQNLRGHRIAIVLVKAKTSRLSDLLPFVSEILQTLASIQPGQLVHVGR